MRGAQDVDGVNLPGSYLRNGKLHFGTRGEKGKVLFALRGRELLGIVQTSSSGGRPDSAHFAGKWLLPPQPARPADRGPLHPRPRPGSCPGPIAHARIQSGQIWRPLLGSEPSAFCGVVSLDFRRSAAVREASAAARSQHRAPQTFPSTNLYPRAATGPADTVALRFLRPQKIRVHPCPSVVKFFP